MSDELFQPSEVASESPRLKWLREHNVVTYHSQVFPHCWYACIADRPVTDTLAWFAEETGANGDSRCGLGLTEDEAISNMAILWGIKLWNEEAA